MVSWRFRSRSVSIAFRAKCVRGSNGNRLSTVLARLADPGLVNNQDRWLAVASALPTVTFWGLDTYFLRCERLFRMLYKRVSDDNDEVAPFFMDAPSPTYIKGLSQEDRKEISWWRTLRRPTLLLFYGAILASAAVIFAIVVTTNSNTRCG
jgi:hypothetical protein